MIIILVIITIINTAIITLITHKLNKYLTKYNAESDISNTINIVKEHELLQSKYNMKSNILSSTLEAVDNYKNAANNMAEMIIMMKENTPIQRF